MLLDEKEKAAAPAGFETVQARGKGMEGLQYRMQEMCIRDRVISVSCRT